MPRFTILVPVYFNEKNLPTTIPRLLGVLDGLATSVEGELLFVEDGSGDRSYEILKEHAARDSRIKVVRLTKNFGAYMALLAGIDHATGDAICVIMSDLQDPPELIPAMVRQWQSGTPLVLAVRESRQDKFMDRVFASLFWNFVSRYGIPSLPKGGFDFVLFDRTVSNVLRASREKNSHFMLQLAWTGFPYAVIPYTRQERTQGKSKWTFSKKIKLFIDTAIAFSFVPIRLISLIGLFTALIGFACAAYLLGMWVTQGVDVRGWTSLMVAVLFLGGIQMLMMGIIGEYIWRTYDETRKRPHYLVREQLNMAHQTREPGSDVR